MKFDTGMMISFLRTSGLVNGSLYCANAAFPLVSKPSRAAHLRSSASTSRADSSVATKGSELSA